MRGELDAHLAEINTLNSDIERQRQLDAAEASMAGVVVSGPAGVVVGDPAVVQDPRRGYSHFGEFAADVRAATRKANPIVSERLALCAAAPSTAVICCGGSRLTSRTAAAASPLPSARRGASGPRTAAKQSVARAARKMPGSSTGGGAPAGWNPALGS